MNPAPIPLRVLFVEDSEDDTQLVLQLLKRHGYAVEHARVETAGAMRAALRSAAWDIVLSDHGLPGFDALGALEVQRACAPDLPFIIVSGIIGEEVAVRAMKAGAADYVIKDRLDRLGPAVGKALGDARGRRERRSTEEALRASDSLKSAILESSLDCIVTIDGEGNIVEFNPAAEETFGHMRGDVLGKCMVDLIVPVRLREAHRRGFAHYLATGEGPVLGKRLELSAMRADGTEFPVELTINAIRSGTAPFFTAFIRDIAERKRNEEALRRFRLAMDNSADMILLIDRGTMLYIDVNPAVSRNLGYSREELLAMSPDKILPVSLEQLEKSYDELIANPELKGSMGSYYICKDGSHLPFESTRHVLRSGDTWIIAAISRDTRERKAGEQRLRDSEARFRQTFELAASGMAHVGLDDRFIRANRKMCEIFGYSEEELIGRSIKDLSHPDDLAMTEKQRTRVRAKEIASVSFEKRYVRKDGAVIWASISVALASDAAGTPLHDILVLEDITERRAQQEKIERLTRVYAVLSGINAAIVRIRDREELFRETCRIAVSAGGFVVARVVELDTDGRARIAATTEEDPSAFERLVAEFNRDPQGAMSLLAHAFRSGETIVSNDVARDPRVPDRVMLTEKGSYALAMLPLIVDKRTVGVITLRAREAGIFDAEEMKLLSELAGDISFALDHIEKEKKLDYLALYDSLTGLANRTLFIERLNQSIHAAAQSGKKFAVVLTDIERLRTVNESLGRQRGDALLQQVAQRIVGVAGRTEAARLAADQFVMVLPTVKGRSEAARLVQSMTRSCFSAPFSVNDAELRIAAKAGIALFPNDGTDAEILIKHAEAALRQGKRTGEPFTFFSRDLADRSGATLTLENKLRQAVEKEEFVLHYQPKVDAETRATVGVEALIRWQSPELGLVPPVQFISLLEETGLILEVGSWALRQAAKDHRRWSEAGLKPPKVAVNVSPIQLRRREFVSSVEQAILEGVAPTGIDLEITESLIMEDIEGNILKLKEIRALGVSIAIDDFGTGYSSLAYLAKLPVQTLKIDRSFVITMLEDADTMALVQTIISLAHSLRLKVVAEGVDAEGQAKVLRLLRCDQMQGYLFSRPLPFDALATLLGKQGGSLQPAL